MSRRIAPPKVDPRTASDLFQSLRAMAPHYTREWPARDEDDSGVALLKIFSFIAEGVISRLNRAPERNFLSFLDMLGVRLLPATPARAPIRFLVAPGTEKEFLVAKGTQVSAPPAEGRPDELPFETIENLLAIPAVLSALIAVDPEKDSIYKPPPGFLALTLAASELPTLKVTALSAAGSKSLQLDPPGQVQEGDFLRIESLSGTAGRGAECLATTAQSQRTEIDYLVVAGVRGPIVTLTEPLVRDYPEGTIVSKVTRFKLFEGKNFQEHVLYLAHAEYFNIKKEARVEMIIEHGPGSLSTLQPLNIAWEFFGVTEESKEEGWHPFRVEVDGSAGFSRNGRLVLIKPPGEIKESEINGNESRWVRARLVDPIPATPQLSLPRIETISLIVSSQAGGIPADQAFHNDTPLTINVRFNPFGPEPRIFDRFYIASAEAFSKPGAEVTLAIDLDFTDLLAAPAGIFDRSKVRAFAHGAAGQLVEFQLEPQSTSFNVVKHQTPVDTRITARSIPAVVLSQNRVGVFVRADDDKVYLRSVLGDDATGAAWNELTDLPGKPLFDPSAAVMPDNRWQVYVVLENQVVSRIVNPLSPGDKAAWTPLPASFTAASTPFALRIDPASAPVPVKPAVVWAIVTDTEGHTRVFDGAQWTDRTPKDDETNAVLEDFLARRPSPQDKPFSPHPHALGFRDAQGDPQVYVFLRNTKDELVVFETFVPEVDEDEDGDDIEVKKKKHQNLGTPPGTVLDSNPHVSASAGVVSVFVRGKDNRLWEIEISQDPDKKAVVEIEPDNPWKVVKDWTPHLNPSEVNLASDPFVITYKVAANLQGDFVTVLSTSDKNALLEFRSRGDDIERGLLRAGPRDLVVLRTPQDFGDRTFFIQITEGPGKAPTGDSVFRISDSVTEPLQGGQERQIVLLAETLEETTTDRTEYILFAQKEPPGIILDARDDSVTVAATTGDVDEYVLAAGQLRQIRERVEGDPNVTTNVTLILRNNWDEVPEEDDEYVILTRETVEENARAGAERRAILKEVTANPSRNYKDLLIEITGGAGQSSSIRRIVEYFNPSNHVVIEREFAEMPETGSSYRVTLSALPEDWLVFRDPDQTELRPQLSWEYWNGSGWMALPIDEDTTENFLIPGKINFRLPQDIAKTEVAGQESYWIRSRIVGGDYGRELFTLNENNELKIRTDPIRPPLINGLSISYEVTEAKFPQFCLTFNNLSYLDQTAANTIPDKHYRPYVPLPVEQKALYMGFDKAFEGGPVRLYFAATELLVDERNRPKLVWEFAADNDWKPLATEDRTDALTAPEIVTWSVDAPFQRRQYFGEALCWICARLVEGRWDTSPLLSGVFVNTVEALQARTVLNEILGSSTGDKTQRFRFQQLPVLDNEVVRVREALTEEERRQLVLAQGDDAVLEISDLEGRVLETWVRWREVIEFFDSAPGSRHYRLDRASGEILFGDGVHGRVPPAGGDNIRAFSYQAGGGAKGNVAAGEINAPVTAVAGVEAVINPVAAGGGSEKATAEEMLEIGPAQLSNRDRAVTPEDFERLAKEASREVRKARCIPNRNAAGRHEVGWTSIHVVPDSKAAQPMPSLELRRSIRRYLAGRSDLTLAEQGHIFVGPPLYVPVNVRVTVYAKSLDVVGVAEQKVQEKLAQFLHPLTGGPAGEGWDFGRDLAASDLYLLLEEIEEVDHVGPLLLQSGEIESEEKVEVSDDALLAGGTHTITMKVANGE